MAADPVSHVFLVLLADEDAAERVRARIAERLTADAAPRVRVLVPPAPLAGPRFLDPALSAQTAARAWWEATGMPDASTVATVCLVEHTMELVERAPVLAARLVVAMPTAMVRSPYHSSNVWEVTGSGEDLVGLVLDAWADRPGRPRQERLFRIGPAREERAPRRSGPAAHAPEPAAAPLVTGGATHGAGSSPAPALGRDAQTSPAPAATLRPEARRPRAILSRVLRRDRDHGVELGRHAARLVHPDFRGLVIVVCNPKGGPGKTTTAIGLALTLDRILEEGHVNGRVVLVDGNTRMSDTFRSMPVDAASPTVRDLTLQLRTAPGDLPVMQHANSRARNLVVLPEQEDSGGYQLAEVEELARHLRTSFVAVVVDLVNDRAGTGSPTERLVQWWLTQADVAVIPTKANLNDFEGAERMLDGLDGLPAVAAYIRPPQRALHRHPRVRERLTALSARVHAIHEIPEDHRVRRAALDHLNLTDAGGAIQGAFARLTLGVLAVHTDEVERRLRSGEPARHSPARRAAGPFGPLGPLT